MPPPSWVPIVDGVQATTWLDFVNQQFYAGGAVRQLNECCLNSRPTIDQPLPPTVFDALGFIPGQIPYLNTPPSPHLYMTALILTDVATLIADFGGVTNLNGTNASDGEGGWVAQFAFTQDGGLDGGPTFNQNVGGFPYAIQSAVPADRATVNTVQTDNANLGLNTSGFTYLASPVNEFICGHNGAIGFINLLTPYPVATDGITLSASPDQPYNVKAAPWRNPMFRVQFFALFSPITPIWNPSFPPGLSGIINPPMPTPLPCIPCCNTCAPVCECANANMDH